MVATRGKRVGVEVEIAKTHEKWDVQASANTVPRTTVTTCNGTDRVVISHGCNKTDKGFENSKLPPTNGRWW